MAPLRCRAFAAALLLAALPGSSSPAQAQSRTPSSPAGKVTAAELGAAVERLGAMDFPVRMDAARTVRRAEPALAIPALLDAVAHHEDWYVRFRALVLLSGFNDPRTAKTMLAMLDEKNDRLRGVGYAWFEHHRDPAVIPRLLDAAQREESEFVRPALTRALAAHGSDPRVRKTMAELVMRGQDLFRAVTIEALGDYAGGYALQPIIEVARLEGPLQDDAALAIGRIGDKRGLAALADLQRTAPRALQPSIAAAICLLGSNCGSHEGFLLETLEFGIANPGHQELVRAAAGGLAALAVAGNVSAAASLFEHGIPSRDPERAAIALAVGRIALRNTAALLQVLDGHQDLPGATELVREAFDMLEEDFEEERFFVAVRRAYWAAPAGSPARGTAETLIQRLEF
jgi:hypothetical protein